MCIRDRVIISDEAIHFPKVTDPNLLLAMSLEAATKYSHDLTAGSVMITDSLFVSEDVYKRQV